MPSVGIQSGRMRIMLVPSFEGTGQPPSSPASYCASDRMLHCMFMLAATSLTMVVLPSPAPPIR